MLNTPTDWIISRAGAAFLQVYLEFVMKLQKCA